MVSRRQFITAAGSGAAIMLATRQLGALGLGRVGDKVTVYLSPTCECCAKWVEHMKHAGFDVAVTKVADVDPVKKERNVPEKLWSCHTAVVGPYTIEGHVPPSTITRLLKEKPSVAGLAVAGMPMGAPGMEHGDHTEPFDVMSFTCCGDLKVFEKIGS